MIKNLHFSRNNTDNFALSRPLLDACRVLSSFFEKNNNNKICIVFPNRDSATFWLTVHFTLQLILKDYKTYAHFIYNSHKYFSKGDRLILNNDAIVEWSKAESELIYFKYRPFNGTDEIGVSLKNISKLQPAPPNRKSLSSYKRVKNAIFSKSKAPLDILLNIKTDGNKLFQKNSLCLISKYKSYHDEINELRLEQNNLSEYFKAIKINEYGLITENSPLLISNNLSNIALHLASSTSVSGIIIDGFSAIQERATDFSDIDVKSIKTILITDLSEIEIFENIKNYGFDVLNFTKDILQLDHNTIHSPFHSFDEKLRKYISFKLLKEICQNAELETAVKKIHTIENDESNHDLITLKISLIQLSNLISRVTHVLTDVEIENLRTKFNDIESLFLRCRMWLGDSYKSIEESISLLRSVADNFASKQSEKYTRLKDLLNNNYDFIICPSLEEVGALNNFFKDSVSSHIPRVISVADIDDKLISNKPAKAILTGWAKSNNMNRILTSFLFSELTLLFYNFENIYFNSLQRRNRNSCEIVKSTINIEGTSSLNNSPKSYGFTDFYSNDDILEPTFDILDFELKLHSAQYSKYTAGENLFESIRAKRVEFENDLFIYSAESHKFLVIKEFIERQGEKAILLKKKIEELKSGDVLVLINTDKDILVELVEKNTNTKELASVKQWTELWKDLLKEYYVSIGYDFKKLVADLRKNNCTKHEVTIRTWLQDASRIGPNDDSDLISIGHLTNSNLLTENIKTVRESIRKMIGWRMKASNFIIEKIKTQIHQLADSSIINKEISIEGLGSVKILKVIDISNIWENIDIRYGNRLLQKEVF